MTPLLLFALATLSSVNNCSGTAFSGTAFSGTVRDPTATLIPGATLDLVEAAHGAQVYDNTLRLSNITAAGAHLMHEARLGLRWFGEQDTPPPPRRSSRSPEPSPVAEPPPATSIITASAPKPTTTSSG